MKPFKKRLLLSAVSLGQVLAPLSAYAVTYEQRVFVPTLVVTGSPSNSGGGSGSSGATLPAVARWEQPTLSFGSVAVGATQSRVLALINDGDSTGNFSSLSGIASGVTADASACGSVAPRASCNVTFVFAPTASQPYASTEVFPANVSHSNALALDGRGINVASGGSGAGGLGDIPGGETGGALGGAGAGGGVPSLSSTSVNFGSIQVGQPSTVQSILLANTGVTALDVGSLSVTGPYAASSNCSETLSAAASCSVNVVFSPLTAGNLAGVLNFGTGLVIPSVALSGSGFVPQDMNATVKTNLGGLSGNMTDTELGSTRDLTVTISAAGSSPLLGVNAELTGSPEFKVLTAARVTSNSQGSCGATRTDSSVSNCFVSEADEDLRIVIRFTPTQEGVKTAALSVAHNGVNASPVIIEITANGVGVPNLVNRDTEGVGISKLSFGSSTVPVTRGSSLTKTLRIENTGSGAGALGTATIAAAGPFAITGSTCGAVLAAGASCDTEVAFAPTVASLVTGQLTFVTTASGGQKTTNRTVALQGYGNSISGGVSPTTVGFGSINKGASVSRTVVFTNNSAVSPITGIYAAIADEGTDTTITANSCGTESARGTVAPQGTCSVTMLYNPLTDAHKLASHLTFHSSADNSPHAVSLSGKSLAAFIVGEGGEEVASSSANYKVHRFTSDGTFTVVGAPSGASLQVLVVGGGGGGGANAGGGGGAGDAVSTTSYAVTEGAVFNIIVGAGGRGAFVGENTGHAGGISVFGSLTAGGGGGGGSYQNHGSPGNGGGGGGAGGGPGTGSARVGGQVGTGNGDGGSSSSSQRTGAGGGGSATGANGSSGSSTITSSPPGGSGTSLSLSGYPASYYACGGGGGSSGAGQTLSDSCSSSGPRNGGTSGRDPANTSKEGSGGGGGGTGDGASGRNGVVVISYKYQ